MFNFFKSMFTAVECPLQLEPDPAVSLVGHPDDPDTDGIATIRQMKNGRFRLLVNTNEVVGTYARKRDAIRGAERKGLIVVTIS